MASVFKRLLQRLLIIGLGVITVWLIVFVIFRFADHRLPWVLALGVTYGLAAYVVLPRAVHMGLKTPDSADMCRASPLPAMACPAIPSTSC